MTGSTGRTDGPVAIACRSLTKRFTGRGVSVLAVDRLDLEIRDDAGRPAVRGQCGIDGQTVEVEDRELAERVRRERVGWEIVAADPGRVRRRRERELSRLPRLRSDPRLSLALSTGEAEDAGGDGRDPETAHHSDIIRTTGKIGRMSTGTSARRATSAAETADSSPLSARRASAAAASPVASIVSSRRASSS